VDGQVVLVSGAIPGERVTARVERVGRGVVYAQATSIDEPAADRREPFTDPMCGGCLYAHIAYSRQLDIKEQVITDAFARIGRITLPGRVTVAPSPGESYRMRARVHRRGSHIGFFREGTHELCDARQTRQLLPATCDALDRVNRALRLLDLSTVGELEVAENVEASQRVVHLDSVLAADVPRLAGVARTDGLSGVTAGPVTLAGDPHVTDLLSIDQHVIALRRHVRTFFQGNRYLLTALVTHVAAQVMPGDDVIDLYAGAGLFSVSVAVARGSRVTAVEGDSVAARDLVENARVSGGEVEAVRLPVEEFVGTSRPPPSVLIVDPPRPGMSRDALQGAIGLRAREVVYVSCDVATLARDARRLLDGGYQMRRIDAFDLFPNTPHVETVVVFGRVGTARP
jgi:23S rRNA (uracil1939-C5)-methyltransferase